VTIIAGVKCYGQKAVDIDLSACVAWAFRARNQWWIPASVRWVDAVNYAGSYGRWWYEVCKDVDSLRSKIEEVVNVRM
jgi:hypothetical protein